MAMERSSSLAALLLLTLVVLAAASSSSGDDAAAAAVEEKQKQCDPLVVNEPYALTAFYNKGGEEIRLLSDKGTETLAASGFANRSGHWFYRRRLPKPNNETPAAASLGSRTDAEGFWSKLGALANYTAASGDDPDQAAADDDDEEQGYMLVGMQTSGGDKIRVLVVAGQRYFFIIGFAKGWFRPPNWFFRDGERHRLLTKFGTNGSSSSHGGSSSSHAEVVASNVLAVMMNDGKQA